MTPPGHGDILIERRDGDRRAPKLSEPVTVKLFVTVTAGMILAALLWLSTAASQSVVTTQRFERDSARRDFRDSMRSRDMQDIRNDVRCIRAVVAKSITVAEVCR